ncbi:DEAD/DEAH box helicase [Paenibacillus thalictri]|uniref:Helicase SNF n=1 Tax=Paenibacillus thalictri TaxID=2527873 RepID=A0A4Q9DVW7_9BACL|nr:DEAD/DEAH box helicase [Paenibacillus thalictri]TBL81204.1 helicase SNF [Paenibacillus thalictri]
MSFQLTQRVIRQLCGQVSYELGEEVFYAGKVTMAHREPDSSLYEATVKGRAAYHVVIEIDSDGDVVAECTCSAAYSYENYCKHIAAVLLSIHDIKQAGGRAPVRSYASLLHPQEDEVRTGQLTPRMARGRSAGSDSGRQLTRDLIGLFGEKTPQPSGSRTFFETRTPLDVEFICKPCAYGYRKQIMGIELKIGSKRLYIVHNLKEFLEKVDRSEAHVFSKHFIYDPAEHCFRKEDDAVIRQLIDIYHNQKVYNESAGMFAQHKTSSGGDRLLIIPPYAWDNLVTLLSAASLVRVEQDGGVYEGICVSEDPIPLQFDFDETGEGDYRLDVGGMDKLVVLEDYGLVLTEGKLLKLPPGGGRRLSELKMMLDSQLMQQIRIAPEQMEPFMQNVVPGFMKLGSVHIAQAVSDRIVQSKLKAKLYLDRVKDRLLAGLEFQYGDIVVNPLESAEQRRGEGRILIRDGEREQQILELLEQSRFARTEGGYVLNEEEAQFDFLYHVIPRLEKLADIYATSAVKERVLVKITAPKVKVDVDERTDWLEFRFDIDGIPEKEIRDVLKALEEKRKYYRMPNGALLPLENAEFQEIARFFNEIGIRLNDITGNEAKVPVFRGLHLSEADRHGSAVKIGKSLRRLLDNMRNPDSLDFSVPDHLAPVLRDYQKFGFGWMKTLAYYRFGGILADDMGLGKTLQSIALLVSVLPEIRSEKLPALIVAPASLMYNWRNELAKFAPEIKSIIADGDKTERSLLLEEMSGTDVVITSYPLLRRDIASYSGRRFHTLILDEAQAFKNHATQTAQTVKELQSRYRFALTGTPVENSLEELWSIFDVVFPQLFPSRKAFNEMPRERIARMARPFMLRRLKSDVLQELPDKIETMQASELLPEQKKLYVGYLAKLQQETLKHLNAETFHKNRIKILAGLTRLRQVICHPGLFIEDYKGGSAKFEQLLDIVEDCRSAGKRMLVFSQFTEMLGMIGRELGYRGVPFFYLDGKTPAAQRVELCERFNDGERELFLISLKAGGTGLNLTGADTVLLYDLWWNPAVEQQAMDRAHRIGQKHVVQVIRLVAQGTLEEKMYALQQRKKHLLEDLVQPGQEVLSALTEHEIRELLMI